MSVCWYICIWTCICIGIYVYMYCSVCVGSHLLSAYSGRMPSFLYSFNILKSCSNECISSFEDRQKSHGTRFAKNTDSLTLGSWNLSETTCQTMQNETAIVLVKRSLLISTIRAVFFLFVYRVKTKPQMNNILPLKNSLKQHNPINILNK